MLLTRIASSRKLLLAVNFVFWLAITVISATQLYVRFQGQYDGGWFNFFWRQSVSWAGWALLTPFIFSTLQRINKGERAKKTLLHILAALGFTFGYSFIFSLLSPIFYDSSIPIWEYLRQSLITGTAANLLVYMLIATFSLMLAYYQRSQVDRENKHRLDLEVASLERQLISAQLETLKSQIQPHFLFNSLHSIASLIRKNELTKATETIAILSELLRATLKNQERNLISLEEEINLINKYLQIEKIRFGDNLDISYDLETNTTDFPVPAFILQPIVENCFKHAFRNRESGKLVIQSNLHQENLQLSVTDNGEGISHHEDTKSRSSLGVKNVVQRLEKLYHHSASFFLKENETGGTTAQLQIPRLPHG
ncbi:MAG: histidine kinase [Roseivirga sp.]|nr:histidine kinase [Roseivirga sp.]